MISWFFCKILPYVVDDTATAADTLSPHTRDWAENTSLAEAAKYEKADTTWDIDNTTVIGGSIEHSLYTLKKVNFFGDSVVESDWQ